MGNQTNFMGWENPGSALITGASVGIGEAFARQLAQQGFDLVLIARRKERLDAISQELQEKYPVKVEGMVTDLSDINENYKIMNSIKEHLDDLDVLINNAGFGIWNTFLQIDAKRHMDQINVHLTSPVLFSHAAI